MMGLRERVVHRFLAKGKKSKLLPTLWVVIDPTPDSLLIDILWKTTTDRLPEYILGSGAARWRKEHAALHDDEQSAKKDALARLKKIHGGGIPEWVLKTAALDRRSGYKGNPDGKDIYPNEINHGAKGEPLAGGTDVMRRLQNDLLHEQGNDTWRRPESPKVASLPADFDEAEAYLNENMVKFPKKNGWWLPAHNLGVNMTLLGKINLWVYSIFPTAAMVKGLDAAFRSEGVDPVTEPAGLVIRPMWVPHPKYRKEFPVTLKTVELLIQMAQQAVTVGETAQRQLKQIEAHAGITIPTGIKAKVIREAPQIAARRWGVNRLRLKSTFIPLDGRKPIPMPS